MVGREADKQRGEVARPLTLWSNRWSPPLPLTPSRILHRVPSATSVVATLAAPSEEQPGEVAPR